MPYGLLDHMKKLNDGLQLGLIPDLPFTPRQQPMADDSFDVESIKASLLADAERRGLPTNALDNNPIPSAPPTNPATAMQPTIAPPTQGGGGFLDFIQSPAGKGLLYGAGIGLLKKMDDRNASIVEPAIAGAKQFKKEEQLKQIGSQIAGSNLTPAQKAFVQAAFESGDSKLIETAAGFLKTENLKPVTVGAKQKLIDPTTGRVIYENKEESSENSLAERRLAQQKWISLPVTWKSNWLAYTNALGISQNEAEDAFISGKTLKELGKEKGLTDEQTRSLNPAYPPTTRTLNTIQQSIGAGSAADELNKFVTSATSPYASNIKGWNINLIADAKSNDPEAIKRVATFIAGKRLRPEEAAEAFKRLGGNVSEAAVSTLMNSFPLDVKIPGLLLKQEHIDLANEMVREQLKRAGELYAKSIYQSSLPQDLSGTSGQYIEGQEYTDDQGNRAFYRNGKWEIK